MDERERIISTFVKHFVLKEKRERSLMELLNADKRGKFTNRLNHKWDTVLNMKYLKKIEKAQDNSSDITSLLNFSKNEICYVISNYNEFDDKFLPFDKVFEAVYSRGLATLLINKTAQTIFLDTEQEQGPADRFIGHRAEHT